MRTVDRNSSHMFALPVGFASWLGHVIGGAVVLTFLSSSVLVSSRHCLDEHGGTMSFNLGDGKISFNKLLHISVTK